MSGIHHSTFTICLLPFTIDKPVNANLKISDASGKVWDINLAPGETYNIGRAKDNDIVLNDRRVSRRHAHLVAEAQNFRIVDGSFENGELKRSVNRVFVNGAPQFEKKLESGDQIIIGESKLNFETMPSAPSKIAVPPVKNQANNYPADATAVVPTGVNYDDKPLGQTQMLISANEIIGSRAHLSHESGIATPEEIKELRRKAKALDLLYEMSKTLGTVFDLKEIFVKATDLIFRGTPAERVVALLADETVDGKILDYSLYPIAIKARDANLEAATEKLTISRTITLKVMREKVALLSQDARSDEQFRGAESIVAQSVRSTICAPLITE